MSFTTPGQPIQQIPRVAGIPFVLPPKVTDGMAMGNGIIRIVSPTANTDITIKHNLGWIPHFVIPLIVNDNGANPPGAAAYVPKSKRSIITAWTNINVTVQFDTTCTNLAVWIV